MSLRRAALRLVACALLCALVPPACGSPGRDLVIDVPPVPRRPPDVQVGEEVGRLLSPDAAVSAAAERRLTALDGEARERFLAYAAGLEGESDLRLLNVLDEHNALPAMPAEATLDFLLWKAAHRERFYVMKAQSRLLDLARREPEALRARLRAGGPGFEVLAVVLAVSGRTDALPALLERYRTTRDARERAAAAEAIAQLAGESHRPRSSGAPEEIESDAEAVAAWYAEERERAQESSVESEEKTP